LIGGVPQGLDRSFRAPPVQARSLLRTPEAPPFVIEGDEYDTAFFEKTAKFLHYAAELVVLTSIEHDHVDIYPTLESYLRPFEQLVSRLPETGLIVANAADEHVVRIVQQHARANVIWYALAGQATFGVPPHWLAAPAAADATGSSFDLFLGGVSAGRWVTPLMGRHNLANVTAALAVTCHGFGVEPSTLRLAVSSLRGAARRQDLLGTPDGVYVYDDFAHHPTAVRETLLGFRERHPQARLFVVFEPRSATASRKLHQAVYPEALAVADVALLAPVARDLPSSERLDVTDVARAVTELGKEAAALADVGEIVTRLVRETRSGDVVAVLSNGTFGGIHQKLLAALEQRAATRRDDRPGESPTA
jgi:UDP-N-acetylmuramate: L-alanyl-gamma-D-glutamyl-meso-diaminopimelate ligase